MDLVNRERSRDLRASTSAEHASSMLGSTPLKSALALPVALYLLAVVTPVMFNVGPLLLSGLRLYLILLILPLLFRLLSGRMGSIFAIDILFLLHVLWMTIALYVNSPDMVVTQVGSVGIEFLGGYLVGRAYIKTPEAFSAMCRWVVTIVVCTLPFAIAESMSGRPVIIEIIQKIPGVFSVGNSSNPPRMGLERAQVVFSHPIHYGLFCSVAVSLCFVALRNQFSDSWRYLLSGLVLLAGFLSLSSGALLAINIQIFLIVWATLFNKILWRWWLLLGFGLFSYIVVEILSNRPASVAILARVTFSAHNAYWRMIIFEWGMVNVWANPIFGIGLNDWVRPSYMYSGSMDNFWLVMTVRYGIPGFLLIATGYAFVLFRVMKRNFDTDPLLLNFRRAWVFTFLGLSFTLSTVHVWTNIYSFVFFLLGAGVWFITAKPRSQEEVPASHGSEAHRPLPYTRFSKSVSGPVTT